MINFNQIEDEILIGSAPQSIQDINHLAKMQITAVLNLQSDADLRAYQIDWQEMQVQYKENRISVHRFPIIDFNEDDLARNLIHPVNMLNTLFNQGHKIYVHCNAGICRAPATVLCYMCHYKRMTIEQGLAHIRSHRPQANPYVKAVVKTLARLDAAASTE